VKRTYKVRCNDKVETQRSSWTFYETIKDEGFLGKRAVSVPGEGIPSLAVNKILSPIAEC